MSVTECEEKMCVYEILLLFTSNWMQEPVWTPGHTGKSSGLNVSCENGRHCFKTKMTEPYQLEDLKTHKRKTMSRNLVKNSTILPWFFLHKNWFTLHLAEKIQNFLTKNLKLPNGKRPVKRIPLFGYFTIFKQPLK